jgi:streptomycin 6-kinase
MLVPDPVQRKAVAVGATRWLDDLPALVGKLVHDWDITLGRVYTGGTQAFVAEATMADGGPAVLKLVVPLYGGHEAENEITVLRLAHGEGCARLFRYDEQVGALLMERLGRPLSDLGLPLGQRQQILCDAASRIWRRAPGHPLPTGAEKARALIGFITSTWEETGRPCTERAVEHALECASSRADAHDDERAVLVHGDVHQWNLLQAENGYKLIDPDGLIADAEYDLGIIMREDPIELLEDDPRNRAHWLASRTGLDAVATWEWGVVERVATGLFAEKINLQPVGRQMLAAADQIALKCPTI